MAQPITWLESNKKQEQLKIRVHKRGPQNLQDLKTVEECAKITPEQLVSAYRKHLEAVITNKGF